MCNSSKIILHRRDSGNIFETGKVRDSLSIQVIMYGFQAQFADECASGWIVVRFDYSFSSLFYKNKIIFCTIERSVSFYKY